MQDSYDWRLLGENNAFLVGGVELLFVRSGEGVAGLAELFCRTNGILPPSVM